MKRIFKAILLCMTLVLITGCTKTISYTYEVATGDKIKVSLNVNDGYKLTSKLPFTITKDGNELSQGTFIFGNYYDEYVNIAKEDSKTNIISSGDKDSFEYVFYSYNNKEYNYVIKIKNSNTAILLKNTNSKEEAIKCFELLNFEVAK